MKFDLFRILKIASCQIWFSFVKPMNRTSNGQNCYWLKWKHKQQCTKRKWPVICWYFLTIFGAEKMNKFGLEVNIDSMFANTENFKFGHLSKILKSESCAFLLIAWSIFIGAILKNMLKADCGTDNAENPQNL